MVLRQANSVCDYRLQLYPESHTSTSAPRDTLNNQILLQEALR